MSSITEVNEITTAIAGIDSELVILTDELRGIKTQTDELESNREALVAALKETVSNL